VAPCISPSAHPRRQTCRLWLPLKDCNAKPARLGSLGEFLKRCTLMPDLATIGQPLIHAARARQQGQERRFADWTNQDSRHQARRSLRDEARVMVTPPQRPNPPQAPPIAHSRPAGAFQRHRKATNQAPTPNQHQSQLVALCMLSEHRFGKVSKRRKEQRSACFQINERGGLRGKL
jgi:hypothetical protein